MCQGFKAGMFHPAFEWCLSLCRHSQKQMLVPKGGLSRQMNVVDRPGSGTRSPQLLAWKQAAGRLKLGTEQDSVHREKESGGGCSKAE